MDMFGAECTSAIRFSFRSCRDAVNLGCTVGENRIWEVIGLEKACLLLIFLEGVLLLDCEREDIRIVAEACCIVLQDLVRQGKVKVGCKVCG